MNSLASIGFQPLIGLSAAQALMRLSESLAASNTDATL